MPRLFLGTLDLRREKRKMRAGAAVVRAAAAAPERSSYLEVPVAAACTTSGVRSALTTGAAP